MLHLIAFVSLFLVGRADAYQITFCAEYQTDYVDADLASPLDDYFEGNQNRPARGALIKVYRNSDQALLFSGNAAEDGADEGCVGPWSISTAVDVKILSTATLNGNEIRVKNDDTNNDVYASAALTNWNPGSTQTKPIATLNVHPAWNTAAAAGWALHRRNGGLSGVSLDFFVDDSTPSCSQSCSSGGDVWLNSGGSDARYIIVHEMGHALGYWRDEQNPVSPDYGADEGVCFSNALNVHEMNQKEFTSAAASEGWAHFYAAVAFNDSSDTSCGFVYYKPQDYNLNTVVETAANTYLDCDIGPTSPNVADFAYMETYCDGTFENRGVELDWLRFWWDFYTETTVTFTTCADIFDGANPKNWNDTDAGTLFDDPFFRLAVSADNEGWGTEFLDHAADNGVDHYQP